MHDKALEGNAWAKKRLILFNALVTDIVL